jgi:phospholipid transport system substrate-binding protein
MIGLRHQRRGWQKLVAASLLTGAMICTASAGSAQPGTVEAEAVVTRLQTGLLRIDRAFAGRPDAARAAALAPLVEVTHDLDYMARLSLGRRWSTLNDAQQREFLDLFRENSIYAYARRFRDTQAASFRITRAQRTPGGRIQVDAVLETTGAAPIPFQYLLHSTSAGWRIINILASGVSELTLQRSQYQRILDSGGFDALAGHLQQKLSGRQPP